MVTSSSSYPPSSTDDRMSPMSGNSPMGSSSTSGASAGAVGSSMGSTSTSSKPELMDRVVQGAHDTVDKLAEKARPQVERLQHTASSASESLHARADHARELGEEWAESLRSTVREHPLAAVGTALALGLIIARLSR